MPRSLMVFAREPSHEARAKGFARSEAEELFAAFAQGWGEAARAAGARLVLATPPQDMRAWRNRIGSSGPEVWLVQSGDSFGERLQHAAASALELGGHVVVVGGDVLPAAGPLEEAFTLLEAGYDAVVGGAGDGGVSLLSLGARDIDLLRNLPLRRSDVCERLFRELSARGRRIAVISALPDVDGRRGLRRALRAVDRRNALRSLLRGALRRLLPRPPRDTPARSSHLLGPIGLRAPPAPD